MTKKQKPVKVNRKVPSFDDLTTRLRKILLCRAETDLCLRMRALMLQRGKIRK
jgi:hypothetical protein